LTAGRKHRLPRSWLEGLYRRRDLGRCEGCQRGAQQFSRLFSSLNFLSSPSFRNFRRSFRGRMHAKAVAVFWVILSSRKGRLVPQISPPLYISLEALSVASTTVPYSFAFPLSCLSHHFVLLDGRFGYSDGAGSFNLKRRSSSCSFSLRFLAAFKAPVS
jgi:hypothetical protein